MMTLHPSITFSSETLHVLRYADVALKLRCDPGTLFAQNSSSSSSKSGKKVDYDENGHRRRKGMQLNSSTPKSPRFPSKFWKDATEGQQKDIRKKQPVARKLNFGSLKEEENNNEINQAKHEEKLKLICKWEQQRLDKELEEALERATWLTETLLEGPENTFWERVSGKSDLKKGTTTPKTSMQEEEVVDASTTKEKGPKEEGKKQASLFWNALFDTEVPEEAQNMESSIRKFQVRDLDILLSETEEQNSEAEAAAHRQLLSFREQLRRKEDKELVIEPR